MLSSSINDQKSTMACIINHMVMQRNIALAFRGCKLSTMSCIINLLLAG